LDRFIILIFLFCGHSLICLAQEDSSYVFTSEVNRVYKPLAISPQTLDTAQTLEDLNPYFKPSWVKEYVSIDIKTSHNGKTKTISTADNLLTQEQLDNIKSIDVESEVSVLIKYIPENNLKHNEIQEEKFRFTVDPINEASFPGGQQKLDQYIAEKVSQTLSNSDVAIHNVKVIQFSITEDGQVINAHVPEHLYIYDDTRDNHVDELLSNIICNMPSWNPAEYASGTKVKQDFVLTVGDHRSCTLNLLNIRREQCANPNLE